MRVRAEWQLMCEQGRMVSATGAGRKHPGKEVVGASHDSVEWQLAEEARGRLCRTGPIAGHGWTNTQTPVAQAQSQTLAQCGRTHTMETSTGVAGWCATPGRGCGGASTGGSLGAWGIHLLLICLAAATSAATSEILRERRNRDVGVQPKIFRNIFCTKENIRLRISNCNWQAREGLANVKSTPLPVVGYLFYTSVFFSRKLLRMA